ncbi:tRNA (adenosine(37)-N6)-threonylcarbamoyltransferase complex transferase subunit TsaD [Mycoplasma sp. 744]|uniref:tRNA (adenosine(37)-N6)-threonylcarbamoyltransferase complex transferase subunit TsaD n=1 Tax=unclassified Mycoplasma TaxID=2683645 RepID=UPI00211B9161|nr:MULTISPECIES: tRNA (adenosine(37)-N6)-threonylcarbamoyltransferase complex transferase subunit TsaD [unclassified Mycoplasma]MEA4115706.1 tRNA (adenosine(37)-N6)-threonylcarbamoyltransferase complex transferase subunit TsaD [Mycoplasma sp. 744]UUM19108.1 tRNA (adenosine(37)-N6)-threonylcarbamoyltransferase complex transferase subunit TsaD [Mycoplasma sp. 1018B]
MRILGIETSHDDTSIAILDDNKVIELITISQVDLFKTFGGTIPELSSREHVKNINLIQSILQNKIDLRTIDYIAYTEKPGLIGTLQIGFLFANALSLTLNKPLIPINHLEGHFYSNAIESQINYPSLCLLVSGGHTQLLYIESAHKFMIIGETLDDAVGETFDKVATKLNLGFPGGPIIDKLSQNYTGDYIKLTIPKTENDFDFSFSGLKSQVINLYQNSIDRKEKLDETKLAVSFQKTAVNYLISKVKLAMQKYSFESLVLAGGVSANSLLRSEFLKLSSKSVIPNLKYATDNAAMIACCAYYKLKEN